MPHVPVRRLPRSPLGSPRMEPCTGWDSEPINLRLRRVLALLTMGGFSKTTIMFAGVTHDRGGGQRCYVLPFGGTIDSPMGLF